MVRPPKASRERSRFELELRRLGGAECTTWTSRSAPRSATSSTTSGCWSGTEGRILEPAVGTGRVLVPLLEAGFRVEGYDTSPEMLAVCRKHCHDRGLDPALHEADMTSFVEPGAYSAVIVPVGSITLLDGRAELRQALACFRECLEPSGRLSVDLRALSLVIEPVPMRSWRAGPFIWTLQTMHVDCDPSVNQTTQWLR